MARRWLIAVALLWGGVLSTSAARADDAPATAREAPDERGADGLRADLERLVTSEEAGGWFVDKTHFDAMYPAVAQSVCMATESARRTLMDRLVAEVDAAGDPRALYAAAGGRMTSDVERALHVRRLKQALAMAIDAQDCPFWVRPERGFDGRQTDRHRVTLSLETSGLLLVRYSASTWAYGASPSIRLMPGYGFGKITVLTGAEFSGGPMLRPGAASGSADSQFVINYFPVVPVVIRYNDVNWHYDLELGALGLFQADQPAWSFGFRAGLGVGLMGLRTRYFIPWAGVAAFYEHYFHDSNRAAAEFIRGGFRIGVIYDP